MEYARTKSKNKGHTMKINRFQLMNDLSSLAFNTVRSAEYDYVKRRLLDCLLYDTIDKIHQRALELIERLFNNDRYFIVSKKLVFVLINDIFLIAHNNSKTIETTQQIKREFDIKQQQKQQEQLHRQQEESKYQNIRHIRLNKEQNSLLGSIGLGDFTS